MKTHSPRPSHQTGSMLIEVLVALLIFSVGILGIVGLQGSAAKAMADAKYRSEAGLLANELIGKMWVSDRTQSTLQTAFSSPGGAAYTAWKGSTTTNGTVLQVLPGAAVTANFPTVTVTPVTTTVVPSSLVTIKIFWQAPNETTRHNYVVVAQIGG